MSGFDDLMDKEAHKAASNETIKKLEPIKKAIFSLAEEPITNYIAFVMDHSGSMSNMAERSRTNFNEQLAQIRKDSSEQENFVTLIEFDSEIKEVCRNKLIDTIKDLDEYWIGGRTALYDSVMHAINSIEKDMPKEGNNAALVTIITDGWENASQENGGEQGRLRLKERITKLQDSGKWTFVFMGADQDVMETAVHNMGIHVNNTMSFAGNDKGIRDADVVYKMSYGNYSKSRMTGTTGTTGFFDASGTNGVKKKEKTWVAGETKNDD